MDLYAFRNQAISEVTVAKLDACATIDASKLNASYISLLTSRFIMLTDARNINLAREVMVNCFAFRIFCHLVMKAGKKAGDSLEVLRGIFDSLDGERLATIFVYLTFSPSDPIPTLAFVVDDTGSMGSEIRSVQRLIRSFIQSERSEPLAYILKTFNDPGLLS